MNFLIKFFNWSSLFTYGRFDIKTWRSVSKFYKVFVILSNNLIFQIQFCWKFSQDLLVVLFFYRGPKILATCGIFLWIFQSMIYWLFKSNSINQICLVLFFLVFQVHIGNVGVTFNLVSMWFQFVFVFSVNKNNSSSNAFFLFKN